MTELRMKNLNLSYFIQMSMNFKQMLLVGHVMFVYLHLTSELSDKIVTKIQWKEIFIELLEASHNIIKFRIRFNNFCSLMNKDTIIKSKQINFN